MNNKLIPKSTGRKIDLVGFRLDRLEVVGKLRMTPSGALWLCLCTCGNYTVKMTTKLRQPSKLRASCPKCATEVLSEGVTKHGGRKQNTEGTESLYNVWKSMRGRCFNLNDKYYGAKGVTVCAEWDDYAKFRSWALQNGYVDIPNVTRGDRMSIDRINPALGYSPENCQWLTGRENSRRMALTPRKVSNG